MNATSIDIRRNNFDLMRLVFALVVVLRHSYDLSLQPQLQVFEQFLDSTLAVMGFFAISGFLIAMSYERSASLKVYGLKRGRRILPAYVALIFICAVAGVFFTDWSPRDYLASSHLWRYLAANLTFLNFITPTLPGVFESNPAHVGAVNGALWSIRTELFCYTLVPPIVWLCRRLSPVLVCLVMYVVAGVAGMWLAQQHEITANALYSQIKIGVTDQAMSFIGGMLIYFCFSHFKPKARWLVVTVLVVWLAMRMVPLPANALMYVQMWLLPLGLSVLVIGAGLCLPHLGNWGGRGDFSYGIYIWHFPIIQVLINNGLYQHHPLWAMTLTLLITFALAFVSWHCIEKRFLRRDSHYVQAATSD